MPSTDPNASPNGDPAQRQELEASERAASAGRPKDFRDEAIKDKVVQVDPIEEDDSAIKGLDPKPRAADRAGSA